MAYDKRAAEDDDGDLGVAGPPPARQVKQERSEATRNRLLEAAVQCLVEFGYAGTTTARVVEKAGFTRGAVLYHFPTKLDLILATAVHIQKEQNRFEKGRRSTTEDPVERFLETLDVVWASRTRPHALAHIEIMIGSRSDPELAAHYPRLRKQMETQLRDRFWQLAQAAGIRDRGAVEDLWVFTVATLRGLAVERLFDPDKARQERAFELMKAARRERILALVEAGRKG